MRLVTRQDLADTAAELWGKQYESYLSGRHTSPGSLDPADERGPVGDRTAVSDRKDVVSTRCPMTTRDALLTAVLVEPDEDTPRLVMADWLDEHGAVIGDPEWAELIRRQISEGTFMEVNGSVSVPFWHQDNLGDLQRIPAGFPTCPFVVRRGMVDEVRVMTGEFLGSPCPVVPREACSSCGGRGYSCGLMDTLFTRWPVRRVTVTDREPYHGGDRWSWYNADRDDLSGTHPESDLPGEVFRALGGEVHGAGPDDYWRTYTSEKSAVDDLSDALVGLGREAAGLPDLTGRKMPGVVV